MKNPEQAPLFAFDPPPIPEGGGLRITPTLAQLSPAQRKFNSLLAQIASARSELDTWTVEMQRLRERHTLELEEPAKPISAMQLALALRMEALLLSPPAGLKLSARRKSALTSYILQLANALLAADPENPELHGLHDRHSDEDLATIREQDREFELEMAENILSDMFGPELVDKFQVDSFAKANKSGAADFEELLQRAHERAQHNDQERPAPKRKRSAKEQAAEARRVADANALSQTLRDIYRKLVSSLHPDREPDASVREQKTALMKRINIAYEANDLLALLTLQMEVEQISSATLGNVSEARLAQYNQILREQLDTLKAKQRGILETLIEVFNPDRISRKPAVVDFDRAIDAKKRQLNSLRDHVRHFLAALNDPMRQKSCIDEIVSVIAEQEKVQRMQEREDARFARFFQDY
jgi:hypothetical protein